MIVNLISNSIAKNKKVLVVCQKRAALDVVYQRLELYGLSRQVALVHDANADRKRLYEKIEKILNNDLSSVYSDVVEKFKRVSSEIEEKTKYFNILAHNLWSKRKCGLSVYELYSKSKSLNSNEILLHLGNLVDRVDSPKLSELLPIFKRLGNYYGRYGLIELRQIVNKIITMSENILNASYYSCSVKVKPKVCWNHEKTLSSGVNLIEDYNLNHNLIGKLRAWVWRRFKGKSFVQQLCEGKTVNFKSVEWKSIEGNLANIYELGKNTKDLFTGK